MTDRTYTIHLTEIEQAQLEELASIAAHERRYTRQRQEQGIAAAKAVGRHLGRRPKMNGQQIVEARARLDSDEPAPVVSRAYSVTVKTLRATLRRSGG